LDYRWLPANLPALHNTALLLLHIAAHKGRTSRHNVLELSREGARDLRNGAWQVVPMRDTKEVRASPAPILGRQSHPCGLPQPRRPSVSRCDRGVTSADGVSSRGGPPRFCLAVSRWRPRAFGIDLLSLQQKRRGSVLVALTETSIFSLTISRASRRAARFRPA
jgi:hypothetical protein